MRCKAFIARFTEFPPHHRRTDKAGIACAGQSDLTSTFILTESGVTSLGKTCSPFCLSSLPRQSGVGFIHDVPSIFSTRLTSIPPRKGNFFTRPTGKLRSGCRIFHFRQPLKHRPFFTFALFNVSLALSERFLFWRTQRIVPVHSVQTCQRKRVLADDPGRTIVTHPLSLFAQKTRSQSMDYIASRSSRLSRPVTPVSDNGLPESRVPRRRLECEALRYRLPGL